MGPACVNGWASSLAFAQPFVITTSERCEINHPHWVKS